MLFGHSLKIASAVEFYILLDQNVALTRARSKFSFRCFPMVNASVSTLLWILNDLLKKTNRFLNLYGDFVEKCSVFVALGLEGPRQSRPQGAKRNVPLFTPVSIPSEFVEKTVLFLTATVILSRHVAFSLS